MPIQVAVATAVLHPRQGGPVYALLSYMDACKDTVDYHIFGVAAPEDHKEIRTHIGNVRLFPPTCPRAWYYASGLKQALSDDETSTCTVYHAHMLWDYPVWAAHSVARARKRPLVITPHGSLISEWRRRGLKKMAYKLLFLRSILKGQTVIHALNPAERDACRAFGIKNPIEIIPNGLPRAAFFQVRTPETVLDRWPHLRNRRLLLFMGRVCREKGLDVLLPAWHEVCKDKTNSDWLLVIAGPDYRGYAKTLSAAIEAMGLQDSVVQLGPVYGPMKESLLAAAECFVLPSHSEAMSVAILEAIAAGLPVVYTRACNLPELAAAGGGWEVPLAVAPLAERLRAVCQTTTANLMAAGALARELGLRNYTLETTASRLTTLYQRLSEW